MFFRRLLLTYIWIVICKSDGDYPLKNEYDVCHPDTEVFNPPRAYMIEGSSTEIFVNFTSKPDQQVSQSCIMMFKSCDACRIRAEPVESFSNTACSLSYTQTGTYNDYEHCIPNCSYFFLYNADYKDETNRIISASQEAIGFHSESKDLHVAACGSKRIKSNVYMRLRLTAERKVIQVTGSRFLPAEFKSPHFPKPYLKGGDIYTYEFTSRDQTGYIALTFDDWLISPGSKIEFKDANIVGGISGSTRRPFVISNGSKMSMIFNAGNTRLFPSNNVYFGFKGTATFYKNRQDIDEVETDCDQYISSSNGGTITLDGAADGKRRDCIWVIKRHSSSDHVYLKIIKYKRVYDLNMSGNTLEVRNGLTSDSPQEFLLTPNDRYRHTLDYEERESSEGFYIRLTGSYSADDSLIIVYSLFTYDCVDKRTYFKCDNKRCIHQYLICDDYDHCGDNSDETVCGGGHSPSDGGSSSTDTPISIGIIIPMVVSVFIIIIICLLIIFIRRCRRLSDSAFRQPQVEQSQPSRSRRRHRRNQTVQMSVTVSSGDHPPSYDEVIQSTPIGYLNMAFSLSHPENGLTQPPSYEEAITPTTPGAQHANSSTTVTASTNNNHISMQPTTNMSAGFAQSLHPNAYVSSSSSEDASDPDHHLDVSSSSDTSTDNDNHLIAHYANPSAENLGSSSNPNKGGQKSYTERSAFKDSNGREDSQVILDSPASVKCNKENRQGRSADGSHTSHGNENENPSRTGERVIASASERSARTNSGKSKDVNNPNPQKRSADERVRERDQRREPGTESDRERESLMAHDRRERDRRDRRDGNKRDYSDSGHRYHRSSSENPRTSTEDHRHSSTYLDRQAAEFSVRPPKVNESSRSQSCANLLFGSSGAEAAVKGDDKRFSYAGAGDISLMRGNMDPYYRGRGLVRDRPIEHLDRYATSSSDNLRDGYSARRRANREYKIDEDIEENVNDGNMESERDKYSRRGGENLHSGSTSLSRLPNSGQYSSLAPLPESVNAKSSEDKTKRPRKPSEPTNDSAVKSRDEEFSNRFGGGQSSNNVHLSRSNPRLDMIEPDSREKYQNTAVRGEPSRSRPSDTLTLAHGPTLSTSRQQRNPPESFDHRNSQPVSKSQSPKGIDGPKKDLHHHEQRPITDPADHKHLRTRGENQCVERNRRNPQYQAGNPNSTRNEDRRNVMTLPDRNLPDSMMQPASFASLSRADENSRQRPMPTPRPTPAPRNLARRRPEDDSRGNPLPHSHRQEERDSHVDQASGKMPHDEHPQQKYRSDPYGGERAHGSVIEGQDNEGRQKNDVGSGYVINQDDSTQNTPFTGILFKTSEHDVYV